MVGGAAMFPRRRSPKRRRSEDHHAGCGGEAAGLVATLEGKGPFAVFAPTTAFGKLPAAP
jgi:hypothetical protein